MSYTEHVGQAYLKKFSAVLNPSKTRNWTNVVLMLAQRRRRWTNIKTSLVKRSFLLDILA